MATGKMPIVHAKYINVGDVP